MIGLANLTFFSVEGTRVGPQTILSARDQSDQAIADHFGHS